MYYFIFRSSLLQSTSTLQQEREGNKKHSIQRGNEISLASFLVQKKKAKYSVGYGTPITCASPSTKNDSRGEKNCTHSQTISFVLSLNDYRPTTPSFSLLTFSISSLWNVYNMFLYIYYIYIIYTCISVAFFISRHVSKKVTLPE